MNLVGGTAFTINMAAALILFAVTAASSPLLAHLGGDPAIASVATVLAIGLVFSAAGSVQLAYLSKELDFRRASLPDVFALIASGLVSVALAFAGFGVWSLVFGYLARTAMTTAMLWYLSPLRPGPRFDREVASELIGYGKHVSLNSVFGFAVNNVDYLIIGYFLTATDLGIYTVAFMVASLPTTGISQVIKTAMFPVYSRLRGHMDQLSELFEDVFTLVWTLSTVAGIGIFICAPSYMSAILGSKWEDISEPMRILAVFGTVRAIGAVFPPAYKALGRPDVDWRFTLAKLALMIPAMLFAVQYGINAVSLVHIGIAALFIPWNIRAFNRMCAFTGQRWRNLLMPQLLGIIVVGMLVTAVYTVPNLDGLNSGLLGPALLALIALLAYLTPILILNQRVTRLAQRRMRLVFSRG